MMSEDALADLRSRLEIHQHTLIIYLDQIAHLGIDYAPPVLLHGVYETCSHIQTLRRQLETAGLSLPPEQHESICAVTDFPQLLQALRSYLMLQDHSHERSTALIHITFRSSIGFLSSERMGTAIDAFAGALQIQPAAIQIIEHGHGNDSVLRLPTTAAEKLTVLYRDQNRIFLQQGITNIQLVTLNFGRSEFIRYSPIEDVRAEPPMLIRIPTNGSLPSIPGATERALLDFELTAPRLISLCSQPPILHGFCIEFDLQHENTDLDHAIYIPWIEQRKEWIALVYRRWIETGARNDEYYAGPFALNDYCRRKLLQAYAVSDAMIIREAVPNIDPLQLRTLSRLAGPH